METFINLGCFYYNEKMNDDDEINNLYSENLKKEIIVILGPNLRYSGLVTSTKGRVIKMNDKFGSPVEIPKDKILAVVKEKK